MGLKGNGPENGAGVNPYVNNSKGGYFWLRSPYASSSDDALGASTGDCVGDDGVDGSNRFVPACALNLESVIFASAAAPAAELQSSSALSDDGVYFRFENPSTGAKISAIAMTSGNTLTINKGSEGGDIYLYVQGNNDDSNDWVYSKKLTQSETIEASTIHSGSTSLENCKVWAETTVDNVTYATNPVDGTSSITQVKVVWPKATVTAPTAKTGLTYNGTAQELVSAGTATNGTMQYSLTSGSGFSTDIPTATDAGTYTVYYKAVGTNGYKESDEGNVSVIIGKKALTVTADNQTVTYGSAVPAYTVTYNGFENNETSSALSGTLAFACSYTTSSNAGTYDITPSGLTSSNYDITFTKGILTVSKADINPTVTLADWTVGGTASTPSVSGNTGNGGVTYKYKAQGADDSTYSTTVPTKAGSYTVKAEVPATTNYNAGEATADFVVKQKMYVTLKNEYGGAITNVDGITLSVGGTALTYVGNGVFSTEGLTVGNHNLTVTVD
ncbi:MAG: MBG domain-containing protein, partial [Oscillospiraceae bacterium]